MCKESASNFYTITDKTLLTRKDGKVKSYYTILMLL